MGAVEGDDQPDRREARLSRASAASVIDSRRVPRSADINGQDVAALYQETLDGGKGGYMKYRTVPVYPQVGDKINRAIEPSRRSSSMRPSALKQAQTQASRRHQEGRHQASDLMTLAASSAAARSRHAPSELAFEHNGAAFLTLLPGAVARGAVSRHPGAGGLPAADQLHAAEPDQPATAGISPHPLRQLRAASDDRGF